MITNIILVGVGGQGILLAAKIIADAARRDGFDVTTHEIHGMAQRGGSVTAQIRYGETIPSPLILEGTADLLGALEQIEAIRYAHYLAPGGLAVVSREAVIPVTVSSGKARYPDDQAIAAQLRSLFPRLDFRDFRTRALELGNLKLANTLLLGAISRGLTLSAASWHDAIADCIKKDFVAANLAAFELGKNGQES